MREIIVLVVVLAFLILIAPASGTVYLKNGTEISERPAYPVILQDPNTTSEDLSIRFFYNTHCGACHTAMAYLDEYLAAHPDVVIHYHDLFNNTESRELFEGIKREYNRPYVAVPVMFMGNAVLEGYYDIQDNFEPLIEGYADLEKGVFSFPEFPDFSEPSQTDTGTISIPLVIAAGLLNGISPCAVAILVIMIIYLMSLSSRQKILLSGLVYVSAVFFLSFLSGTGLFTTFQINGMLEGFSFVAAIIAIGAGALMIKDAVFPGTGSFLSTSEESEGMLRRVMDKISVPAGFVLGIVVGMCGFPCTGEIYRAILPMISLKADVATGLGYLLLYNLAFIAPLLVIIGLVAWFLSPERVSELKFEQRRTRRIIIGLIMFFFAAMILMEVF